MKVKIRGGRGYCNIKLLLDGCAKKKMHLMSIPANGTLSLIANVSGGIEPIFSFLTKQMIQGNSIFQLQPTFKMLLINKGVDVEVVYEKINQWELMLNLLTKYLMK